MRDTLSLILYKDSISAAYDCGILNGGDRVEYVSFIIGKVRYSKGSPIFEEFSEHYIREGVTHIFKFELFERPNQGSFLATGDGYRVIRDKKPDLK